MICVLLNKSVLAVTNVIHVRLGLIVIAAIYVRTVTPASRLTIVLHVIAVKAAITVKHVMTPATSVICARDSISRLGYTICEEECYGQSGKSEALQELLFL